MRSLAYCRAYARESLNLFDASQELASHMSIEYDFILGTRALCHCEKSETQPFPIALRPEALSVPCSNLGAVWGDATQERRFTS